MEAEVEFSHEGGWRSLVRVSGDYRHVEVADPSSGILVRMDADLPEIDPEKCDCSRQVPHERRLGIVAILEIACGFVGLANFLLEVVVPIILGLL